MTKKEGKVETLIITDIEELKERLSEDFQGKLETLIIDVPGTNFNDVLEALSDLKLYEIVSNEDPNLKGLGVELGYYSVNPIVVTDINLQPEEDHMLFNGVIEIPKKKSRKELLETYFVDEEAARDTSRVLNEYTNGKVEKILKMMTKSLNFRRDIVEENLS